MKDIYINFILFLLKVIFNPKYLLAFSIVYIILLQCISTVYATSNDSYANYQGYGTHKIQDDSGCDIITHKTSKEVTMCNGTKFEIRPLTEKERNISPVLPYWQENQLVTDKEVVTIVHYEQDLIPIQDGNVTAEDAHYHSPWIDAQSIANKLLMDILIVKDKTQPLDVKQLVYDCIKEHVTKSAWAYGKNPQADNVAGEIIAFNTFYINDKPLSDINKQILAHINVHIFLTNFAIENNFNIENLLQDNAFYEELYLKQFIQSPLVKEEDIINALKSPSNISFYDQTALQNTLQNTCDNLLNKNASSVSQMIYDDILSAQNDRPEIELKFLVNECLKQHNTKSVWAITSSITSNENTLADTMAGKIIGLNYSYINDPELPLEINDKIVLAHINVQVALTNIAITKHKTVDELLNNDALYDHLFQKQFKSL